MRKINTKNIVILILLIIMLILQVKAFRGSRANKLIDITAKIIDSSGLLSDKIYLLQAFNEEENGTAITLPSVVDEKKIEKYIVEIKQIKETDENDELVTKEKLPGEKIYLTESELENEEIELIAVYESKTIEEQILYNKVLEKETEKHKITIVGYMPSESQINVENVSEEVIVPKLKEHITENTILKVAYDITIISEEQKYEPNQFDENVEVTISGIEIIDDENYKILHIDDDNNTEEVKEFQLQEDAIKFNAQNFSTYVVLSETSNEDEEISTITETITDVEVTTTKSEFTPQNIWDGKTIASGFSWGTGTLNKPYLIADGSELAYLAQQVNNGTSYEGMYFQLASDIDLGNNEWTPIGTVSNSFKGTLDGAGHTIANVVITVSDLPDTTYDSYGLFGSIGGGDSRNYLRNIELTAIEINITASGSTATTTTGGNRPGQSSSTQNAEGIRIGCLTGTMYKNSSIENIIVSNSSIYDTNTIQIYNYQFQFAVGGVVGYITNTYNSDSDPGDGSRYVINNCYSNVEIELDSTATVSSGNQRWTTWTKQ